MPESNLTPAERRSLKARAHQLQPVVMIGNAGLTPQVLAAVETALKSHELIKIRVLGEDRNARGALIEAICQATGASAVQRVGRMLVIYRQQPPESAERPSSAARKRTPDPRKYTARKR